ncbi:hypothetical protein HW130_02645 [Streptomyces sp. PKU-EA00015]|nr:hypothetical protein [Streptomyces sp. PKU-EA00015]
MSHQQLVALIASASPAGASNLSAKLAQASSAITKIGEDLKEYVTGLPWHGEGGDAFREWGGQTASATLRLGEYSKGASRWMELVAEAITEAKAAMPPVSETTRAQADLRKAESAYGVATDPANRNDPDARGAAQSAQSDAAAAQGRIDAARFEAAQRLRKLAQTYEFSAQQVNAATPPTFPPPAKYLGDGWRYTNSHKSVPGEGAAATARPVTGAESPTASISAARPEAAAGAPQLGLSASPAQPPRIEPPTRMEIDSAPVLPTPPSSPAAPPVGPPPSGTPDPRGMPPVPVPPVFGKGQVKPSLPSVPSVTGRPGQGGVRPPVLPSQGLPDSGSPGRLPRDSGIVGGRPVPPSTTGPARGIPRGLVVGGEGTPTARGPVGHQPAMGTGNGTPRPGAPAGRRYASEAGGIVGGNPQQASRPGARPITPGGSGSVSGATPRQGVLGAAAGRGGAAAPPPGSTASAGRRDEQGGGRPDYLTEDEETWRQNGRRIVPPVVE